MSERRASVDKKNHSRVSAINKFHFTSIQKKKTTNTKKFEVTCIKCRFTKQMSQKQWNNHQWKVHNMRNEAHIGAGPPMPTLFN